MINSVFDSNTMNENKSLEFKHKLLTSVNVEFNYYPINCQEIQKTSNTIQCVYRGNANRPNIYLNNKDFFTKYYQTSDLTLYGNKLHEGFHDAELVIKHIPISSCIIPIYVCFFLYNQRSNDESTNIIDDLIQSNGCSEIDISLLLKPYIKENEKIPISWKMYETVEREGNKCFVILIEKPILFNSSLNLLQRDNDNFKYPFMVKNIDYSPNYTHPHQQDKEGFVVVSGKEPSSGDSSTGYALDADGNEMICEIVADETAPNIDLYQIPLSSTSYKNQKNIDILTTIVYSIIAIMMFFVLFFAGGFIYSYIIDKTSITQLQFYIVYCSIFIAVIIGCLYYGINNNQTVVTMIGVLISACFIVITAGIKIVPNYYMKK